MLTEEERDALRKKFFPRVEWTELGPVRRIYRVKAAEKSETTLEVLSALARQEGFTAPGLQGVTGGAETTLAAFRSKAQGDDLGMVFGTELEAHWCDIALDAPDSEGWQRIIVRSEEGENLIALAHNLALLRFRRT